MIIFNKVSLSIFSFMMKLLNNIWSHYTILCICWVLREIWVLTSPEGPSLCECKGKSFWALQGFCPAMKNDMTGQKWRVDICPENKNDVEHSNSTTVMILSFRTPQKFVVITLVWTIWIYHRVMSPNDADGMANSVEPDQTAPLGAVWSGSALFAQAYLSENLGSLR